MEIKGVSTDAMAEPTVPVWISGWRLVAIAAGSVLILLSDDLKIDVPRTSLSLFMVQTESSVTSTAIASITNSLGGFDESSWIFTAYLLTYSGRYLPVVIGAT